MSETTTTHSDRKNPGDIPVNVLVGRVLQGEHIADVAAGAGVSMECLSKWTRVYSDAGEAALKETLGHGRWGRMFSALERLSPLATWLTIMIAVFVTWSELKKDRELQQSEVYNALDARYIEYVKLCLANPEVDGFDVPLDDNECAVDPKLTKRRQSMMFAILVSILERAFLYRNYTEEMFNNQWPGWDKYIKYWASRPAFVTEWGKIKEEFDVTFMNYMDECIRQHSNQITKPADSSPVPTRNDFDQ